MEWLNPNAHDDAPPINMDMISTGFRPILSDTIPAETNKKVTKENDIADKKNYRRTPY